MFKWLQDMDSADMLTVAVIAAIVVVACCIGVSWAATEIAKALAK